MKFKNREGSTFALTLMVFAVLMIFATFILSFMVTENKQAMYHQNKTQAYYLARSGAEAVETAILGIYNDVDNSKEITFFNKIFNDKNLNVDNIEVNGNDVGVSLELENITGNDKNFILNIYSTSSVGVTTNIVHKILNIPKPIIKTEIKANSPIIYLNQINENIIKINELRPADNPIAVKASTGYPLIPIVPDSFPENIVYNPIPSSGNVSGNFYVENLNGDQLKNLTFNGNVNIYVKKKYIINATNDISINSNGEPKNLNIYVYEEGISITGDSGKNIIQKANLSVKSGKVSLNGHKIELKGNLVLGDSVELNVNVDDNGSVGHANIEGMIYGPTSVINIGDDNKGAFSVEGSIIGYDVNYRYKVNSLNQVKLTVDNSGGIKNPIEFEDIIITTIEKGYYK